MLATIDVKAASNGHAEKRITLWPTQSLQALVGDLPFDEMEEIVLALKTCQELDDEAMEELASLKLEGDALADVEILAFSAAIRRWYAARLAHMRENGRIEVLKPTK